MPKPQGSIGGTKFKILAILYKNNLDGQDCYGYGIWTTMKKHFHHYLDEIDLRNVYRHLKDLEEDGLIQKSIKQNNKTSPDRQFYLITEQGKQLKNKFDKYIQILNAGP